MDYEDERADDHYLDEPLIVVDEAKSFEEEEEENMTCNVDRE